MHLSAQILKDIVVTPGYMSLSDFTAACQAAEEVGKDIPDILVFRGFLSEADLGKLIAEYFHLPFADVKTKLIPQETLQIVPEKIARKYHLVPIKTTDHELHVAMEEPQDLEAIEYLKRQTGLTIIPYYSTDQDLSRGLAQYKSNIKREFASIIAQNVKVAGSQTQAEDLPVIKILNTLLEYAEAEKASDIHIETLENDVLVRFRVDGVLRDIINLPKVIQAAIIARIKILSSLKLDEHRVPQDGRFKFAIDGDSIALRVSIIPGFYGENVVLRLLTETARPLSLEELGFTQANLITVQAAIKQPHGMVLVTGPTGSGKTTTLYSLLNILNTSKVKICTIEDPVEYGIHRVNQIQVNTQTGLTFAKGLRALLRHDPNIIMVGEIRDKETAEIGIHSALTGHLVLSTLHTNDAPSAIPRFLDMGAEAYLLASTINMVIAQRLVRKICQTCIVEYQPPLEVTSQLAQQLGKHELNQKYYRGKGCDECGQTGYKTRIGVYEVFEVTSKIRELIISHASSDAIRDQAVSEGMVSIFQDGMDKVASGITTIEEVLRVVRE